MLVKETSAAKLFRGLLVDEYSPKDYKGISEVSRVCPAVYSEDPPVESNPSLNGR